MEEDSEGNVNNVYLIASSDKRISDESNISGRRTLSFPRLPCHRRTRYTSKNIANSLSEPDSASGVTLTRSIVTPVQSLSAIRGI